MHPDDIAVEAEGTATAHEPEESNQSPTKHLTVRAPTREMLTQDAIDEAIERGLKTLTERTGKPMMLLQATPVIRNDGAVFVTVIAHPALYHEEKG